MLKPLFKSKKGIGTVIGTIFFITLVLLAFNVYLAYGLYQAQYDKTKTQMNEFDIARLSENLEIIGIEDSTSLGYTFDIVVNNKGGVDVTIARIYIYNQTDDSLQIYDPKSDGGYGFVNGTINVGEAFHRIPVKAISQLSSNHYYRIVLATDRGRQFSTVYHVEVKEEKGIQWIEMNVTLLEPVSKSGNNEWKTKIRNNGPFIINITFGSITLILDNLKNPTGYLAHIEKVQLNAREETYLYFEFLAELKVGQIPSNTLVRIMLIGINENGSYCIKVLHGSIIPPKL